MLPQQESTIFRDKVRTGISTIQAQLIEEEIHALFGADLWAIVVYGSRVHHLWVNSSDLDLLVIAENIPDCKSRDDLLLNTCMKLEKLFGFEINFTLLKPMELCRPNSLTYEMAINHYIIYEKSNFITQISDTVNQLIREGLIKRKVCRGIPYWVNNNEKEISKRLLSKV
jgi:predicted nucleotidyltransferase